jgi:hypothetical protein
MKVRTVRSRGWLRIVGLVVTALACWLLIGGLAYLIVTAR